MKKKLIIGIAIILSMATLSACTINKGEKKDTKEDTKIADSADYMKKWENDDSRLAQIMRSYDTAMQDGSTKLKKLEFIESRAKAVIKLDELMPVEMKSGPNIEVLREFGNEGFEFGGNNSWG